MIFNGLFFIQKARRDLLKLSNLTSCIKEATELPWIDYCLIYSISCKEASNLRIKINSDGDLVQKSLGILTSWSIALTVENQGLISEFICICQASISQHLVWQTYYFCFTRITCTLFTTDKTGRKYASSFQKQCQQRLKINTCQIADSFTPYSQSWCYQLPPWYLMSNDLLYQTEDMVPLPFCAFKSANLALVAAWLLQIRLMEKGGRHQLSQTRCGFRVVTTYYRNNLAPWSLSTTQLTQGYKTHLRNWQMLKNFTAVIVPLNRVKTSFPLCLHLLFYSSYGRQRPLDHCIGELTLLTTETFGSMNTPVPNGTDAERLDRCIFHYPSKNS